MYILKVYPKETSYPPIKNKNIERKSDLSVSFRRAASW